jgi:5-methylcytosine-specific restriction protein A
MSAITTPTYLLAWNPKHFAWHGMDDAIRTIHQSGSWVTQWSCGHAKGLEPGDRFFLIRLGSEPRGILGSGQIVSSPRVAPHWDPDRAEQGEKANFVEARFEFLSRTPLIRRGELEHPPYAGFKWDTQMSGVRMPGPIAGALEREWKARVGAGARPPTVSAADIQRWQGYCEMARALPEWIDGHAAQDAKRTEVLPEIRGLIQRFVDGEISLASFREEFDLKTRNE